jgi:Spy/CpxP family protein refolding chaperone
MKISPSSRGGVRMLAIGLLVLAFAAGALGGVAADRLLDSRGPGFGPPPGQGGGPAGSGGGAIFPPGLPLARQLDLTPEQRRQIGAILTAERAKADSVMRAVRPVLQARYDSTSAAVRALLTPEQRERFDRLRDTRRDRLRRRGGVGRGR